MSGEPTSEVVGPVDLLEELATTLGALAVTLSAVDGRVAALSPATMRAWPGLEVGAACPVGCVRCFVKKPPEGRPVWLETSAGLGRYWRHHVRAGQHLVVWLTPMPSQISDGLVTSCPSLGPLLDRVRSLARSGADIDVEGPPGSGCYDIAREAHEAAGGLPDDFHALSGYTATPADLERRLGPRDHRRHETLYVEGVGELPPATQEVLARLLERPMRSIVVTSHAEPLARAQASIAPGLMPMLRACRVRVPSLAERAQTDLRPLAFRILGRLNVRGPRMVTDIARDALAALLAHDWPRNVTELTRVLTYAHAVGEGPVLRLSEMAFMGDCAAPSSGEAERVAIEGALVAAQGRIAVAARQLRMSRSTLWRRRRALGLLDT